MLASVIIRSVFCPARPRHFRYSIGAQQPEVETNVLHQLDQDGARILRVVKNKLEQRVTLVARMSAEMPAAEKVIRAKQIKELEPLHHAWNLWMHTRSLLRETIPLLNDSDPNMRCLALDEYNSLIATLSKQLTTVFPTLLTPTSTTAHLSAIIELKSGVGGTEASLFLADLLRMYIRFANNKTWKVHIVSCTDIEGGGNKDAIVEINGAGSYDILRWESGIHRVQRVPSTDASGRVHTSTVAVVVLPLSEDMKSSPENNDYFSLDDVKVEVMRSRGAGGQHVNKTESAVRLTHQPTGITVSMQDERSQHQNKRRAFQILRARLLDMKLRNESAERRATRRNLIKTADRNQKIRTYNFPQNRVTDHRIGLSITNPSFVMDGDGLQGFLDALRRHHEESIMEDVLED